MPVGFRRHILDTRQPLLINENYARAAEQYGNPVIVQGEAPRSVLFVPLIVGEQARGYITLQDLDHEQAFSDSDVRLLSTLAASLSVALENTRLFEQTRLLLAETEQRAAELAIINSVQEGLAAQLDMQAIFDMVGDKIQQIFDMDVVDIGLYDRETDLIRDGYSIERGVRLPNEGTYVPYGFRRHVIETRQPLLINSDAE